MSRCVWAAIAVFVLPVAGDARAAAKSLAVHIDFPGGSAEVTAIDQDARRITLGPTKHRDRGWTCWWYFKVTGITPGEVLTIDVGDAPWATPDRATFSTDGTTWQHTAPGKRDGKRIVYRVPVGVPTAWFGWGPPFTPGDAEKLCRELAEKSPDAEHFELCRTRGGRSTPALRVGNREEEDGPFGVWVQARQHAWESGSSWVGRGFARWLTSDDEDARWLREHAFVTFVPVMDVDNVAIGAGGKNQVPRDHNRDWTDEPRWRSVAAAQKEIVLMNAAGRFDLFIDLHNPAAGDRRPFYFVAPDELLEGRGARNLEWLLAETRATLVGPPAFLPKPRVSGSKYDRNWRAISKNWVTSHTGDHVVAVTLETSWNTEHATTEGYERIGRQLGVAIRKYLERGPRSELEPKDPLGDSR